MGRTKTTQGPCGRDSSVLPRAHEAAKPRLAPHQVVPRPEYIEERRERTRSGAPHRTSGAVWLIGAVSSIRPDRWTESRPVEIQTTDSCCFPPITHLPDSVCSFLPPAPPSAPSAPPSVDQAGRPPSTEPIATCLSASMGRPVRRRWVFWMFEAGLLGCSRKPSLLAWGLPGFFAEASQRFRVFLLP